MARKTPSRLDMRRMTEAAEARGEETSEAKPRKKATATRTKRTKEKVTARKRLVWVVYNGSMKEEGRFPYDQKAQAEERMEQLRAKSKKLYFLQPVKEMIGEGAVASVASFRDEDEEELVATVPEVDEEAVDIEELDELEEEPELEESDDDEDLGDDSDE